MIEAIRPSCLKACEQLRKSFGAHPMVVFPDRDSSDIGEFLTCRGRDCFVHFNTFAVLAPCSYSRTRQSHSPAKHVPGDYSADLVENWSSKVAPSKKSYGP